MFDVEQLNPIVADRDEKEMPRYWSHLQRHELYDLAQHPQVVRELKADYAQWFKLTKKPMAWDEHIGRYWRREQTKGLTPVAYALVRAAPTLVSSLLGMRT
jgi:hypothetical protein